VQARIAALAVEAVTNESSLALVVANELSLALLSFEIAK
jgi:hypothetical protein